MVVDGHSADWIIVVARNEEGVHSYLLEQPAAELVPYRLVPRGSTALLDAIGRTISDVRARIEALDPAGRPGHIVFAVITDGLENASKEWSRLQVMDCVHEVCVRLHGSDAPGRVGRFGVHRGRASPVGWLIGPAKCYRDNRRSDGATLNET